MPKRNLYLGMDVRKDSVVMAVLPEAANASPPMSHHDQWRPEVRPIHRRRMAMSRAIIGCVPPR